MRFFALLLTGLVWSVVWLVLLLVTGFSGAVVGLGLLGMLLLTSSNE